MIASTTRPTLPARANGSGPAGGSGDRGLRGAGPRAAIPRAMASVAPARITAESSRSHDTRDVQQLLGVVGSARSGSQDEIVACALTLGPRALRGHPGERMEPVDRAGRLREEVREAVSSPHVRELVQQDDPEPFHRPPVGFCRHQHRRSQDAPRHRHRRARASQEGDTGDTPRSAASWRASGSHEASATTSARRDIHCTASMPTSRRAMIVHEAGDRQPQHRYLPSHAVEHRSSDLPGAALVGAEAAG